GDVVGHSCPVPSRLPDYDFATRHTAGLVIVVFPVMDFLFFFSSRRRHTRSKRDWSSDVCSSDLHRRPRARRPAAFGLPIGEAFQLRDDVLGVYGDPALTGKPAGDDLREGKRTVLVTSAMTRADQEQRSVLRTALGNPDLQSQDVDRVREILTATGAVREVDDLIEERVAEALQVLDDSPVSPRAAAVLRSLVQAAVRRTS